MKVQLVHQNLIRCDICDNLANCKRIVLDIEVCAVSNKNRFGERVAFICPACERDNKREYPQFTGVIHIPKDI